MCCPTHELHHGLWAEQGVFWVPPGVQGMVRVAFALGHEAVHPLLPRALQAALLLDWHGGTCARCHTLAATFWVLPHSGASGIQLQKLGGLHDPLF